MTHSPPTGPQQQQVFGGFGPFIPAVNANSNQGLAVILLSIMISAMIFNWHFRTPALDLVLEQWVPLPRATVSLDRTVTSHSGELPNPGWCGGAKASQIKEGSHNTI